ncbi:metallophosphoesterase family protein [Labilibaculum euxinus]|uniref:Twin-arginine translocation signal domain-containing protein n=1 Tax=Labilibaculum euxinus TaxID=2686357 RepID=A0A7M4D4J7_9BACT|nr:metallophosphoesterase family protein [Labilibaculum euxinus]MUP37576.1 twin-arginine translocation signal domain-containing protein [Labilibaculum euxinus]MVB06781.1 twin-arginine translocation signal domain-containing protein [Labilibaculum euxinus]
MERRAFLKNSAFAGALGVITSNVAANSLSVKQPENEISSISELSFNKEGKFKILQLTDTHYIAGNPESKRALNNVNQMLDLEKPDLVIHTGDVIFGIPAERSLREILSPISERKIPFAVALGNHDEEYDKTRDEVSEIINSMPYNINKNIKGITGSTNCIITLNSSKEENIEWVFYLFDTNRKSTIDDIGGYGYINFDQIAWYRQQSQNFTKMNGDEPIPSMAFFHIPIIEYKIAACDDKTLLRGIRGEEVCSPKVNSGVFASMKEMGDIKAISVGHDHDCDYAAHWNNMFLLYGRFSGCDTVYNNIKPNGARVFELTEGEDKFRSWIRLYGGKIIQDLQYPDDFVKKKDD